MSAAEMTDNELSRAVALACGWTLLEKGPMQGIYEPPGGAKLLSDLRHPREFLFATSLDACFGLGGPGESAKGRGWYFTASHTTKWHKYRVHHGTKCGHSPAGNCDAWVAQPGWDASPSRALCLAFLQAIEAQP